jgi:hypothetical protein
MRTLVESRPGFAPERLVNLMNEAIEACQLNLSGAIVLTEGATLAYAVTPVVAAMAGAESVIAVAQSTPYGSVIDITAQIMTLASKTGVGTRIRITRGKREADVRIADIVTNSGNVRPIDARMISWMKPTAVVSLMFEAWEIKAARFDVDLAALRRRGIAFAGTNERHPAVGVFNYLPAMALRLLNDAGLGVYGLSITLLCDNPFADYLLFGLERADAQVRCVARVDELDGKAPDVLFVAMTPTDVPIIDTLAAARIAKRWPTTAVVQFWGDIDRAALAAVGLRYWPVHGPRRGHMAILPSDLGPDPVVRLQAGGLKVGEVLLKPQDLRTEEDREFLDEVG